MMHARTHVGENVVLHPLIERVTLWVNCEEPCIAGHPPVRLVLFFTNECTLFRCLLPHHSETSASICKHLWVLVFTHKWQHVDRIPLLQADVMLRCLFEAAVLRIHPTCSPPHDLSAEFKDKCVEQ